VPGGLRQSSKAIPAHVEPAAAWVLPCVLDEIEPVVSKPFVRSANDAYRVATLDVRRQGEIRTDEILISDLFTCALVPATLPRVVDEVSQIAIVLVRSGENDGLSTGTGDSAAADPSPNVSMDARLIESATIRECLADVGSRDEAESHDRKSPPVRF